MIVYVMRHGKTVWNEKRISQGHSNNRLSQAGKIMTEEAALKLKDVQFDAIFCSPLMRTMQTANIINKYHNAKEIKDSRLIEIDQGILTGKSILKLTEEEKELRLVRDERYGIESYKSVYERIVSFVKDLKQYKQYETILIVTHNVTASCLENIFRNVEVNFSDDSQLKLFNNAEVKVFKI